MPDNSDHDIMGAYQVQNSLLVLQLLKHYGNVCPGIPESERLKEGISNSHLFCRLLVGLMEDLCQI